MINAILCFLIGHKVHYKGAFNIVEAQRFYYGSGRRVRVFRCYRCGCEVERKIKL